jgi:hypothetical protein
MSCLLEELLEIVKKRLGAFFRSYEVETDLETAYSRIVTVRLIVNKRGYVDVMLVEDLSTGKRKQSCYYMVDDRDVWGFSDVPHHKELSSFPYREHIRGKPEETEVRTIDEALAFIVEKANKLEK